MPSADDQEFSQGSRKRPISHARLNPTPNEIALAVNKITKWTSPDIRGRIRSKRMLNPKTITTGGSVHHFDTCTVDLRSADIGRLPPQRYLLLHQETLKATDPR